MRLLRLDLEHGRQTVDLHPFVTVVRGLRPDERTEMVHAVQALARGLTSSVRGLVQNQGLLVELDGLTDDRLIHGTGAHVIVECGAASVADMPSLRVEVDQLRRLAEIDRVLVEEIRADLDPSSVLVVSELEHRLGANDGPADERRRRNEHSIDDALAAIGSIERVTREAPPGVVALSGRWRVHAARMAETEGHRKNLQGRIEKARGCLVDAQSALTISEENAKPHFLTRDEEHRLELLSFPGMDDTRRGRWRNKLRPEEEDEMAALLDKVGVDSWTAYTVFRVAPSVAPERVEAAATARRDVDEAALELQKAEMLLESDQRLRELDTEIEAIRAEARHYLGMMLPADLGTALGELVVEHPNPVWEAAVDDLESLMHAVGAEVHSDDRGATVEQARNWLIAARAEHSGADLAALSNELTEAKARLVKHERALARIARAESVAEAAHRRATSMEEQLTIRADGGPTTAAGLLALVEPMVSQIELEANGSVPIMVITDFEGLAEADVDTVLDRFKELSEELQIIVVSDNEAAVAWTKLTGLERSLASRVKEPHR